MKVTQLLADRADLMQITTSIEEISMYIIGRQFSISLDVAIEHMFLHIVGATTRLGGHHGTVIDGIIFIHVIESIVRVTVSHMFIEYIEYMISTDRIE